MTPPVRPSRPQNSDELIAKLRHLLAQRKRSPIQAKGERFRETAVLVPLIFPENGAADALPELLYIVRHAGLPTHSGQIAFPGGKREPADPSLFATALRESHEEVGMPRDRVEILGLLDDVPTLELFAITPVVGILRGPLSLSANEHEVADIFYAPIDALVDCYKLNGYAEWHGARYAMHEFHFPDPRVYAQNGPRRVWGATARITYQLLELLQLLPTVPERDGSQ